jgi:hypothetical protein
MSPVAIRWLALPLGLFAFAGRAAHTFWSESLYRSLDVRGSMLVTAGAFLVSLGIPALILILLTGWRPPARLQQDASAVFVPQSPLVGGSWAILAMWIGGGALVFDWDPEEGSGRMIDWRFSAVAIGLFWTIAVVLVLVDRPRLEFDADGRTIRRLRTVNRIAWDRLAPGGPQPPRKGERQIRLYLTDPPLLGTYPPSVDVPVHWLYIDPTFLAETIRRYVEHPEERAALPEGGKPQGAPSI